LNSGLWFLLFLLIVFLLRHVDHGGKHLTSSSYCPIKGGHLYNNVVQNSDYEKLLELYNRKSLSSQVSNSLGLANGSLPETVVRLAKGDCQEKISAALKPYFGNFQQHMA
jgi:hypothetical protein